MPPFPESLRLKHFTLLKTFCARCLPYRASPHRACRTLFIGGQEGLPYESYYVVLREPATDGSRFAATVAAWSYPTLGARNDT